MGGVGEEQELQLEVDGPQVEHQLMLEYLSDVLQQVHYRRLEVVLEAQHDHQLQLEVEWEHLGLELSPLMSEYPQVIATPDHIFY